MADSRNTTTSSPGIGPLDESGIGPSGTVQQDAPGESVGLRRPRNDSDRQEARSPTEENDRPELPIEVRAFCSRNGIDLEIERAIELARKHFSPADEPSFEVVDDPEHGESYVGVHIRARGGPEDIFRRGRAFSDSLRDAVGREKRRLINVIYHAV